MARMTKDERHEMVRQVADEAPEGMVLTGFQVENVMKIRFAAIQPKGNVIVVGGRNRQGKSTILKAIGWLLTGTASMPSNLIRTGQKSAKIIGQVGPFKVTRMFAAATPAKLEAGELYDTRIKIEGPRGEEYPSPQILLNHLLGYLSFDPLEFIRLGNETGGAKKQCEILRGLAKFEIDLEALDAAQVADYQLRRDARGAMESVEGRLAGLEKPAEGASAVRVDTAELVRQLQDAAEQNNRVAAAERERARLDEEATQLMTKAALLREKALLMLGDAAAIDGFELKVKEVGVGKEPTGAAWELRKKAREMVVGEPVDVAGLGEALNAAEAANRAADAVARYQAVAKEFGEAEAAWKAIDERMKVRKVEREAAMQAAVVPLEGLAIGEGEVLFNGLPFDQASGAEQIQVSLAIGMAGNPKMRVLRFMDGGWDMLDEDSQKVVRAEIEKHGFQLWVEHVGGGDTVTVVMEEGEAEGSDVFAG